VGEAKGAEQTDAVILGGGETVADDNGAADEGVDTGFEDVGSATRRRRAGRLREQDWLNSHGFEL